MCRFVLYIGEPLTLDALTTRPKHSLIRQSYKAREREEPLNGDGFGIAWYADEISEEPALFRSTTPAWNNANLRELARVTRSGCVLAHVRAATPPSPVTELNCHPFKVGRLALMHNGFIPGFGRLRRDILRSLSTEAFDIVQGSTDSEHILAMFYDRWRQGDGEGSDRLANALHATLEEVEQRVAAAGITQAPHLNVVVSDGSSAVVSRYCKSPEEADSLHLYRGRAYVCDGDTFRTLPPKDDDDAAVLVASEALSGDPGWEDVPVNHLVVIDQARRVSLRPRV